MARGPIISKAKSKRKGAGREKRACPKESTSSSRCDREILLLQSIASAANEAIPVESAFRTALELICNYTGWPIGLVYFLTPGVNPVLVSTNLCQAETPEQIDRLLKSVRDMRFAVGAGLPGRVLASGKVQCTNQLQAGADFPPRELIVELGLRANVGVPVLVGSQVVAVIEFFSTQGVEPGRRLLELIESVCVQLGRLMERKQAESAFQEQFRRLNILNQITAAIAQQEDLNAIFQAVLQYLENYMPLHWCGALLFNPGDETLALTVRETANAAALRDKSEMIQGARIPARQSGLWPATPGSVYCVPNTAEAEVLFLQRFAQRGAHSLLAAPLTVGQEIFGLLLIARIAPDDFSSSENEFIRMLGEHLALAIHQTRLLSGLQHANKELKQTQLAVIQQDRLRALGQMASGIAHDINNALSPAVGFAELLLRPDSLLSPQNRKYVQHIKTAAEDVAHIVARMREVYRKREEREPVFEIKLNSLARQVIEITRPRWRDIAQEKGSVIEVRFDLDSTLPPVMGIESELREALTNLILNAVDAMPEGGTLTLRTQQVQSPSTPAATYVIIEVIDTGTGMDEETRKHCLEPFFSTKGEQGTGLGLAMVYGVIERHEGYVEIESELGSGTTFRIIIPTRDSLASGQKQSKNREKLPPARILFIDDEPLLREVVKELLSKDGHSVDVADGGPCGIDLFVAARKQSKPYDVVITDLGMPHINGHVISQLLKRESPQTPIILLTGWGGRSKAEGEAPPPVDLVLNKPPRLMELRNALRTVLAPAAAKR